MTKRYEDHGFILDFADDAVDQDFVELAFQAVRTRGGPDEFRFPGPCDVWGYTPEGDQVRVYVKAAPDEEES